MPPSIPDKNTLNLLDLPAEIRTNILEYVFEPNAETDGLEKDVVSGSLIINEHYKSKDRLQSLLTCRQLYQDGSLLALKRTNFLVSNLFVNIPEQISTLHPKQISSLRSISFIADARHFRKFQDWGQHPFGLADLDLDTVTVILHRSGLHYLFDFTATVVRLLRGLHGVRHFVFVRNEARVKGSFKTWYNRLIGLMMKIDHGERYDRQPAQPEQTWWKWSYDEVGQSFCLDALPPKPVVEEETYLQQMLPLMEELRTSVENEEWNPDPRARNMFY